MAINVLDGLSDTELELFNDISWGSSSTVAEKNENTLDVNCMPFIAEKASSKKISLKEAQIMLGVGQLELSREDKKIEIPNHVYIVDAKGKTFGCILLEVSTLLRGKHKPSFTPNVDCGDYVIIINAKKVIFLKNNIGKKDSFLHSGYKNKKIDYMLSHQTEKLFKLAIRSMLPKTTLGKTMLNKLKVFKLDIEYTDRFNVFILNASKENNLKKTYKKSYYK